MPTELIKNIYNSYLKTSRGKQNKPFKFRKNFDGFDEEDKFVYCKRLERFFTKYPYINMDEFFEAPFELFEDFKPQLKFYASLQAVKCYNIVDKRKQNLHPDTNYQIQFAKRSFSFIISYCINNNLKFEEYIQDKSIPERWVKHLKTKKINIYSLMAYPTLREKIENLCPDIAELYLGSFYTNYYNYRRTYMNSKKMKLFVEAASKRSIIKINESIDSHIKNQEDQENQENQEK